MMIWLDTKCFRMRLGTRPLRELVGADVTTDNTSER